MRELSENSLVVDNIQVPKQTPAIYVSGVTTAFEYSTDRILNAFPTLN